MIFTTATGRLVRDPEYKPYGEGRQLATLRLASDRGRKGPDGKYITDFIDLKIFPAPLVSLCSHLTKGSRLTVNGRLECREVETDNGKRQFWDINVDSLELGPKPSAPEGDGGGYQHVLYCSKLTVEFRG